MKQRYSMWKTYKKNESHKMNEETVELSMVAARYEIHLTVNGDITVQVRCRKGSRVYNLCKKLGFEWF